MLRAVAPVCLAALLVLVTSYAVTESWRMRSHWSGLYHMHYQEVIKNQHESRHLLQTYCVPTFGDQWSNNIPCAKAGLATRLDAHLEATDRMNQAMEGKTGAFDLLFKAFMDGFLSWAFVRSCACIGGVLFFVLAILHACFTMVLKYYAITSGMSLPTHESYKKSV